MNEKQSQREETGKQTWRQPALVELGKLTELVQGGGGKLSGSADDPGEIRKTRSTG
jgi:hypothetical protein